MFSGSASVDTTPVTGSLHFAACDCRLTDLLAVGLFCVLRDSADCLLLGVFRALRIVLRLGSAIGMATGVVMPADAQSGVTFDVELEVPWNAPEAYIQLDSEGVYDLATVPDVFGLRDRRGCCQGSTLLLECANTRSENTTKDINIYWAQ